MIVDHGIDPEVFDSARRAGEAFFSQPLADKLAVDIASSKNHRGYVSVDQAGNYADEAGIRRYEAYDVGLDLGSDHPLVASETPLMGPNVWPVDGALRIAAQRCYDELRDLSDRLLDLIAVGLELRPEVFREKRQAPVSQMRLLNYLERPDTTESHVAMGAHTDYEYLTLIRDWGEGLEVHTNSGTWTDVSGSGDALIVLAGDLLEVATGGAIRSALHRVKDITGTRFSIPFFAGADFYAEVTASETAVTSSTATAQQIVAGSHLLRQLQRDFPYLRERYRTEEVLHLVDRDAIVDVTDTDATHSMFERRRLAGR